jgi:hypothetical protein
MAGLSLMLLLLQLCVGTSACGKRGRGLARRTHTRARGSSPIPTGGMIQAPRAPGAARDAMCSR